MQCMLEQPAALRRARETVRQRALAPYTAPISPEPDPKFGDEDATSLITTCNVHISVNYIYTTTGIALHTHIFYAVWKSSHDCSS
jgi:hypothetical protein